MRDQASRRPRFTMFDPNRLEQVSMLWSGPSLAAHLDPTPKKVADWRDERTKKKEATVHRFICDWLESARVGDLLVTYVIINAVHPDLP